MRVIHATFLVIAALASAQSPLTATVVGIRQERCAADQEVIGVTLYLTVKLTNGSDQTLLLYRSPPTDAWHIRISRSIEDLRAKTFVWEVSPLILPSEEDIVRTFSDRSFVQVHSGGFHTVKAVVWIPAARVANLPESILRPGTYWLQFRMETWPYSPLKPSEVASLITLTGRVWSDSVSVEPMPFTIAPPEANPKKCEPDEPPEREQ